MRQPCAVINSEGEVLAVQEMDSLFPSTTSDDFVAQDTKYQDGVAAFRAERERKFGVSLESYQTVFPLRLSEELRALQALEDGRRVELYFPASLPVTIHLDDGRTTTAYFQEPFNSKVRVRYSKPT
ncbi:hypothetical protein HY450_00550 [Candidatus Pacearchaeota archaeon]|nr:hypothetical protein [Candidatus Pacearchaeota archaeon]